MTCYFYLRQEAAHQAAEKNRLARRLAGRQIDHWFMDESNELQTATQPQRFRKLLQTLGNGDTLIVERLQDLRCGPLEAIALINALMSRMVKIVILEVGEHNLAAPENKAVIKMLNAIIDLEPEAFVPSIPESVEPACRSRLKKEDLVRETIITQYSLGKSVTSLARQYNVSRSTIAKIVQPASLYEPFYQRAFGD